jgi:putative ABC transport system ATP-binding protein
MAIGVEVNPDSAASRRLSSPVLRARGVTKAYGDGDSWLQALRGVNLEVGRGELVAVTGPSGCGKTTLLHCLSGLDDIDAGRVELGGRDLFTRSDAKRAQHRAKSMGFVFQAFNLVPVFSAAENVELPLLLGGIRGREARRRARAMLGRVGLSGRAAHRPHELSGGEQQRVAVARALVADPEIVWADEPTGSLDSAMATVVMDLLCDLHAERRTTIMLVSHDEAVFSRAGRLLRMWDGSIVSDSQRSPTAPAAAPVGAVATCQPA